MNSIYRNGDFYYRIIDLCSHINIKMNESMLHFLISKVEVYMKI